METIILAAHDSSFHNFAHFSLFLAWWSESQFTWEVVVRGWGAEHPSCRLTGSIRKRSGVSHWGYSADTTNYSRWWWRSYKQQSKLTSKKYVESCELSLYASLTQQGLRDKQHQISCGEILHKLYWLKFIDGRLILMIFWDGVWSVVVRNHYLVLFDLLRCHK